jgi:hypothetical protein
MEGANAKTTVVLLASLHLDESVSPSFVAEYRDILHELGPSLICAELSPEQLRGTATCNSKPEYEAAVLPVARELGAQIVPIQMPTDEALDWQRRLQVCHSELRSSREGRFYLDYSETLEKSQLEAMLRIIREGRGMEYFQHREYDWLLVEPTYSAMAHFFPELNALYDEWNQYFLDRIVDAISEFPAERIVVTAGGFHKYWLWDRLCERTEIDLHNLQSYRAAR